MKIEQQFISVKEVMTLLGVGKASIYRYVETGKLKSYKLGGRTLFDKNEVINTVKSAK